MRGPKKDTLIYISGPNTTYMLSFPDGTGVGSIKVPESPSLCSDGDGQVFFPQVNKILEYDHGGTKPIATLKDPGYRAHACSWDPKSGNLAIANVSNSSGSGAGNIAIYQNAAGDPTLYSDDQIKNYSYCGYDDGGNLFLVGVSQSNTSTFAELPYGAGAFTILTISKKAPSLGQVEWDGHYLALGAYGARTIYRLSISGSSATVIGTTKLAHLKKAGGSFWIHGNALVTAAGPFLRKLGLWRYARGGRPTRVVGPLTPDKGVLEGVAVSVRP
jgi:hypothetical protein